jgi:GH24 family phage-related lysozyme (muramidase)
MANTASITLEQVFRFYRGLPHQMAAIVMLEDDIRTNGYAVAMRRDRPWFAVWSQDGKQGDADGWVPAAQAIVQQFEGCRLTAYPDPGTGDEPWTIGWGATRVMGRPVQQGQTITQAQADAVLEQDLRRFRDGMVTVLPMARGWSSNRQAALISFAFNIGIQALYESTLRKRLLAGEDPDRVVSEELPRWTKGGNGEVLAGLVRRRAAEVALFCAGSSLRPAAALPVLPAQPAQPAQPAKAPERPKAVLLDVPYFQQNDNKSGTGYRECFSSTCAMVAAFWGEIGSDDEYNLIRKQFGDTTSDRAQIEALRSLGLFPRKVTNAAPGFLEAEIRAGRPVAVGWLHKGPVTAPAGGGHWSLVIGFDAEHWIHHDPNGEANMVNGGYVNHKGGRAVRYSRRNWERRWMVDGPSTGWALQVQKG